VRIVTPLLVTALHLALLATFAVMKKPAAPAKRPHKQLVVRMVEPLPPPPPPAAPPPPPPAPAPKPKPKPKPKAAPPKATKPKPKPKPKPAPPKRDREREKKLREVKERIAKIGQTKDKSPQSSSTLQKAVPKLAVDRTAKRLNVDEQLYCDELARRLRLLLRLPEFGEIKLLLTIDRSGTVCGVEVVRSLSVKNRTYVIDKLSSAQLPNFGTLFAERNQETFPITLTSEM